MKIGIQGLNKALVLAALYDGAFDQAIHSAPGEKTSSIDKRKFAEQLLKGRPQSSSRSDYSFDTVDLGDGPRKLAVDLSDAEIDVSEYDALYGEGAAQKTIEKYNTFAATVRDNESWLRPMLSVLGAHAGMKQDFISAIQSILLGFDVHGHYEKKPYQAIYIAWIHLLDPRIDQQTKESLCQELAATCWVEKSKATLDITPGAILSSLPPIISAPVLLYSPINVLQDYHENRSECISQKTSDAHFERTLKILANDKLFPKPALTLFLNKVAEMLRQNSRQLYHADPDDLLHKVMASWERQSLTTRLADCFDPELQAAHDKFEEKLQTKVNNPDKTARLISSFDFLVFERILTKSQCNDEALHPVVTRFFQSQEIYSLAAIYKARGLAVSAMFKLHLLWFAKFTNGPDAGTSSAFFFSNCLNYLIKEYKTIALIGPQIASFLSAEYYAKHAWAFSLIRKDMFSWWLEHKPEQIIAIIKAVLQQPEGEHNSPIDEFFSSLPPGLYDKLAALLSESLVSGALTPEQFITVYTASAACEACQIKILPVLLQDENNAVIQLRRLGAAYKAGTFSSTFPKILSSQLKAIHPALHQQAEREQWVTSEDIQDDLETDFRLLGEILGNQSLTDNRRQKELRGLQHLRNALNGTDTCALVMQMFDRIPQTQWIDLFNYFELDILFKSFPENQERLELRFPDPAARPAPRANTWLDHPAQWENILYGSLLTVFTELSERGRATHSLFVLDRAFARSTEFFPGMVDKLLKKFFLDNAPDSIKIFTAFKELFYNTPRVPVYFSKNSIYNLVASWLPDDPMERSMLLAKLFRVDGGLDAALERPFVRNNDELLYLAIVLIGTGTEHLINLLERFPEKIRNAIFRGLYQFKDAWFLNLLQNLLSGIGEQTLPMPYYMRSVLMLLSSSRQANINIFDIIDADPNKDALLEAFAEVENWSEINLGLDEYKLIFSVVFHYQLEPLQNIIFGHMLRCINKDDLYTLCFCLEAVQTVFPDSLVLPEAERQIFLDYVTKKIPKAIGFSVREIKIIARFIPNADGLLTGLLVEASKARRSLSDTHTRYLDNLVRVYGFSRVNALCLASDLANCSAYLVKKFSKFPDLLQVSDDAVDACYSVLNNYRPEIDSKNIRCFVDNLRAAIAKAAQETETKALDINIVEICTKSKVPQEVLALMPGCRITSPEKDSTASLLASRWEKSGLLPSSSVSVMEPDASLDRFAVRSS